MSVCKWLPLETEEEKNLFRCCKDICLVCECLIRKVLALSARWQHFRRENTDYVTLILNVQELEKMNGDLTKVVKCMYKVTPMLYRIKDAYDLLYAKRNLFIEKVCNVRFLLVHSLVGLIKVALEFSLRSADKRKILEAVFRLITRYNELIGVSSKTFIKQFNVCSNACPGIISHNKPFHINTIIKMLASSRAEDTCHRLIDCLVQNHAPKSRRIAAASQPPMSDNERAILEADQTDTSSTSSIEIYQALTKHLSPQVVRPTTTKTASEMRKVAFAETRRDRMRQCKSMMDLPSLETNKHLNHQNSDSEVPYTSLLDSNHTDQIHMGKVALNNMLRFEDLNIEIMLDAILIVAPALLGDNDAVKKNKRGELRVRRKTASKLAEKYLCCVLSDVASQLEHIVLWWGSTNLAARSPSTSQSLRDWLTTFNSNNTPDLILGALRSLADSLGCHVALTSWDKLFGGTLVSDVGLTKVKIHPEVSLIVSECTVTGANFVLLLQELVSLSNQCEVSGEYILGADVDQLPIVEQIPILHRLDHSIHTCRLWCVQESRRLANLWEMNAFFRILQNDIPASLEQLTSLRFADHSIALQSGNVGVHEMVCAKMREKLVSEIKENIKKLKDSAEEITCVLAAVATTICLAQLQMIFPTNFDWRILSKTPDPIFSGYVPLYLDRILLPVLRATKDNTVINMILRIMCESWLHHIYVSRVKFSKAAAVQLLADFNEVRIWIDRCKVVGKEAQRQMLSNEVLRRCEGVGRLLLHSSGDPVSMLDSTSQVVKNEASDAESQLMPAEMYVPNQQQWLTLKTRPYHCHCCYCVI